MFLWVMDRRSDPVKNYVGVLAMMGMFLCIDFCRSRMGIGICKNVLTTQLK